MTALHKTRTYKPQGGWKTWPGHMPSCCLFCAHSEHKSQAGVLIDIIPCELQGDRSIKGRKWEEVFFVLTTDESSSPGTATGMGRVVKCWKCWISHQQLFRIACLRSPWTSGLDSVIPSCYIWLNLWLRTVLRVIECINSILAFIWSCGSKHSIIEK